jgi:1,4-alpha-glucan branching enzyme
MAAGEPFTLLSEDDLYLFNEGTHTRLYRKLGSHLAEYNGKQGTYFAVWAPDADAVSVIGDFNGWERGAAPLQARGSSGIWEGFIEGVGQGASYKYFIRSRLHSYRVEKADPYAVYAETPPKTASVVWDLSYDWGDGEWMSGRRRHAALDRPVSIYEVHLGSWMRGEGDRPLTYRELAERLPGYAHDLGFTHVEFLPVMEHPFYGSWGYQVTGFFAPTSRYGTPQDFMHLVDALHRAGVGVILDWVPSHFPTDQHGLGYFDGTHLYEHADPRRGFHPDWDTFVFNYGRNEVRSFLLSNAMYWIDLFHADGLRVDAVASMLYLDYSRKEGEWVPNQYGGREDLDAIGFLRQLNTAVYGADEAVQTFAEESTAWPMVSRPVYLGGLGFGYKWDMGWMHDTLRYMAEDPVHRKYHHYELSFRMVYGYTENFVLPLSHDEVVHGKGSLLDKMPGDDWQKFANLRLLLAYQWAQPGKKLLFQGGEFGQWDEWRHDHSLDWHLLEWETHRGVQRLVRELNRLYGETPSLFEGDCESFGFEWVEMNDADQSVLAFLRRTRDGAEATLCVFNFTPVPRENYRLGVSMPGRWDEILNSDAAEFGGSGIGNLGGADATPVPAHGRHHSLIVTLPPLAAVWFRARRGRE